MGTQFLQPSPLYSPDVFFSQKLSALLWELIELAKSKLVVRYMPDLWMYINLCLLSGSL